MIKTTNNLRYKSKMLKAQGISYKEQSEYLQITPGAMWNWLSGQYELGAEKERLLAEIISILWQETEEERA